MLQHRQNVKAELIDFVWPFGASATCCKLNICILLTLKVVAANLLDIFLFKQSADTTLLLLLLILGCVSFGC